MIAIICPSIDEMELIKNHMKVDEIHMHALLSIYTGTIYGKEAVLLFSGVCKVNAAIAAQSLIDRYSVKMIILSGVAGAIDNNVKIYDTIIATDIAHHDVAGEVLTEYHPWMNSIWYVQDKDIINKCKEMGLCMKKTVKYGKIISGECFITEELKPALKEKYDALAVDMESASVAQVCYANKVPLMTIRTITDKCDENGIENFDENVKKSSAISGKIVIEYIKRFG